MRTRIALRFSFALLSAAFCVYASATALAADEDVSDATDRSLLRVAEAPAKPDGKKYDLRYKVNRGDVLRYEVTHRASIRSTIDNTTQAAQTKTDSIKAWKVTDVLPEGEIEFTNVVEKVHMVNQLPEKDAVEYDSTKDPVAPPGFEDAAKAVGVPLSVMRITPRGKVVRRDVKIHGQSAEDDAPIVLRLPEQPVAIGDTWDESFEIQVKLEKNNTKMIQTRRHHKLAGVKNGIATIEVTYQVLSPIDATIETQIVQRLMEGEARFDVEKGQLIGQQMDVDKRIIGFAGATSSMQYIMKMEESLVKDETTAKTSAPKPSTTAKSDKPASKTVKPKTETASRAKATRPSSKKYRR